MATENIGLTKPTLDSAADITALDANWDIIDSEIGSLKKEIVNGGDMKSDNYDSDGNGVVDDADKLGGMPPSHYASSSDLDDVQNSVSAIEDKIALLPVVNGGTGASTASAARTSLGAAPAYSYSTTDLTSGSSALATGKLYFVYE